MQRLIALLLLLILQIPLSPAYAANTTVDDAGFFYGAVSYTHLTLPTTILV